MKKLSICFLILICLVLSSCTYNPFKEVSISIYNKCAWEIYLNVSGGDYDESFSVGKSSKSITVPIDVEYTITLSSPYDYSSWTVKTTPKLGTNKWTFDWSSYKGSYTFDVN